MNSIKVDGKLIAWVYPKSPPPCAPVTMKAGFQWKWGQRQTSSICALLQCICDSEVFRNVFYKKKYFRKHAINTCLHFKCFISQYEYILNIIYNTSFYTIYTSLSPVIVWYILSALPVFSVTWSFRHNYNMLIIIFPIINIENSCLIFYGNRNIFFQNSVMNRSFKEQNVLRFFVKISLFIIIIYILVNIQTKAKNNTDMLNNESRNRQGK